MTLGATQSTFDAWLDDALAKSLLSLPTAYCFNLAEPWCVELFTTNIFDELDPDWACGAEPISGVKAFNLSFSDGVGETWELVLQSTLQLVASYLDGNSSGGAKLRDAKLIGVGFVDGDLHHVWPR